jgi:hypothetical protein
MTKDIRELRKKHKLLWNKIIEKIRDGVRYKSFIELKKYVFTDLFFNTETSEIIRDSFCFGCYNAEFTRTCWKGCLFDTDNRDLQNCLNDEYNRLIDIYIVWLDSGACYNVMLTLMRKIRDWPINRRLQ